MKPGSFFPCSLLALLLPGALSAQEPPAAPEIVKQVPPEYPADLKSFFIDVARVQVIVDPQGIPLSLISNTGLPDYVVQALSQWRFRPAPKSKTGAGYAVTVRLPIRRPVGDMIGGMGRFWHASRKAVDDAFAAAKDLDETRAAALEKDLAANPDNLNARLSLLAFAAAASGPDAVQLRLRQILWLAKNMPGAQVLGAPLSIPHPPAPSEAALYEELRQTWLANLAANPKDPVVLDHATNFLRFTDPEVAEKAAQQALDETHRAAVFLGDLYGLALLGVTAVDPRTGHPVEAADPLPATPFAQKARAFLASTDDLRILFSALSTVSAAGPSLAKGDRTPAGYIGLCEALLARARSYYPETRARCEASPPPPSEAERIIVGGNVEQAMLLKHLNPPYPPEAKAHGLTGTITFRARIGKDGLIHDLELLRGPLAFYASARGAVSRWTYKPTMLEGKPVEVLTQIDVNYTLNTR